MKSQAHRTLVQRQFGPHAQAYAASAVHASSQSLRRLVELVDPQPGWRMLDVATGAGHTAGAFAPCLRLVAACDVTFSMLQAAAGLARRQGLQNLALCMSDVEALPFPCRSFDLLTCRLAAHHFASIPAFLAECARLLVAGGRLAVVDNIVPEDEVAAEWVNDFERARDPSHAGCLSLQAWLAEVQRAGFQALRAEAQAKAMDFEAHCERMGLSARRRAALWAMLQQAPPAAREFLHPEEHTGRRTFVLTEGWMIAAKDPQPSFIPHPIEGD